MACPPVATFFAVERQVVFIGIMCCPITLHLLFIKVAPVDSTLRLSGSQLIGAMLGTRKDLEPNTLLLLLTALRVGHCIFYLAGISAMVHCRQEPESGWLLLVLTGAVTGTAV